MHELMESLWDGVLVPPILLGRHPFPNNRMQLHPDKLDLIYPSRFRHSHRYSLIKREWGPLAAESRFSCLEDLTATDALVHIPSF